MAKILLVSSHFPTDSGGGISKVIENIAKYSEHDLDVLSYYRDSKREYDFDIYYGDYDGYSGLLKLFINLSLNYRDYDAIYFDKPSDVWTSTLARLQGKKIFSHVHGTEVERQISRYRSHLREGLFDFGLRIGNKFIAVSNFTRDKLISRGADESKVEIVHNGVEFDRFNNSESVGLKEIGVPENEFLLITVSRLEPKKSQDLVMEAIQDLEDVHYLIVGTGNERSYLEQKMKELDISEKVTFAGYVEDDELPCYYNASDLYVMPSRYIEETGNVESWGISFLEANSAGKAVIGANNGGMPESIKDGETGFLAETNPDDVREKIVRLKENDDLRAEIEDNAVEWAQEHDWPKVVSKIDKIIEDSI